MRVLLESQSSDLLRELVGFQLKPSINGEISSQDVKYACSLTRIEQRQSGSVIR